MASLYFYQSSYGCSDKAAQDRPLHYHKTLQTQRMVHPSINKEDQLVMRVFE